MKKIITSLFVSILAFCGFSVALDIPVTELQSMASCNPNETDNINYYLTSNGLSRNPYDTFGNTVDSLIGGGNNGSSINIWRHGVISSCNIWNRVSNVVSASDSNGALVFLNTDNCVFNIPNYTKTSNPTAIDAQIHYTIGYRLIYNGGANTMTSKLYHRDYGVNNWTCYPNGNIVSDFNSCNDTTVKYGSQKSHTGECLNYRVFWCGDGLVNSPYGTTYDNGTYNEQCDPNLASSIPNGYTCNASCQLVPNTPAPYCGDGIINLASEDCDPGSGNFGNGCNSNCKLMTPNCTLTANPNQGNIPLTTSINGTTNGWWARITNLNFGDGQNIGNGWDPVSFPQNHTYSTVGTFYLTGTVRNIITPIKTGAIRPVAYCSINVTTTNPAPQPYCGDGILQSNEQCDPGSGNFGNGCNSNCQLMTPSCTLTVNPNQGTIPLNTTINGTKPNWAKYTNLAFGDGQNQSNPVFTLNHTYSTVGAFNLTLTVQNNYNGQVNGTKPTAYCTASVITTQPGSPVPYLLKQQKTGGMANFTSNQINVQIGEQITYKVNFGNSGTVAATGEVWDILPPCVNYISSSIHLPNGVSYNGPTVGPVNAGNQTMVKYSNFRLNPRQGGYMLVQAQVRGTGMNGMISCQNVYSYTNTGYFKFVGGNTLSSQVVAVRPQAPQNPKLTITKELLSAGNLVAGDLVSYKITLKNIGSGVATNAYILDTMPRALQYVSSSIQGVANYLFTGWTDTHGQYNFKYYNFNLNPNQTAIVYLTGRLRDGFSFNELTNCAFTSGANDCAIISGNPVPYILKEQKYGNIGFTTNTITVQPGNQITYKVSFGNSGTVAAIGQVRDVLPPCVKYVSSSIHLPSGVSYNGPITGMQQGGMDRVVYKDFRLNPGQGGYMLVVAEIKSGGVVGLNCSNTTSYLNTGYFKFVGGNTLSSQVLAIRQQSTASTVIFDKTGNKTTMYPGETGLEFTISVTNRGPNPISNIYVDDIWPDNETCIIYDGWTGTTVQEVSHLRWRYVGNAGNSANGTNARGSTSEGEKTNVNNNNFGTNVDPNFNNGVLAAGQSFSFKIFAHVANNPACVGPYVNTGKLTYVEGGSTHELYDDYPFQVIASPELKLSITKTVDKEYVSHGETVTYTIVYTNNGNVPLTNYTIVDYWPAMIQFVSANPSASDITNTANGTTIKWRFSTPLLPGKSGRIVATGIVR